MPRARMRVSLPASFFLSPAMRARSLRASYGAPGSWRRSVTKPAAIEVFAAYARGVGLSAAMAELGGELERQVDAGGDGFAVQQLRAIVAAVRFERVREGVAEVEQRAQRPARSRRLRRRGL